MNDHDLLTRIEERMGYMQKDIRKLTINTEICDTRMDKIENWKAKTIGIAITFPVIIPVIIFLLI